MTRYFLPDIRGIVAHELSERGTSQSKIARVLGITQPRVSHYLSNKKSIYYSSLSRRFGTSLTELEGFARILADDASRSQIDGIFTLYSIWKNMLFNGEVCAIHQTESSISKDCSVCMDLRRPQTVFSNEVSSKQEESIILRDLSDAIVLIESSSEFPQIMPEVSVNIAMCKDNSKSKRDVAAIPGRISKIHGRARSFVLPEFGSSNHMSNVLLLFKCKLDHIRSVMNLRYDESMGKCLSSLGIHMILTDNRAKPRMEEHRNHPQIWSPDQVVLERLSEVKIAESISISKSPFAVIDEGSEGLEPITYLFGTRATELSQLALRIAHICADFSASEVS
jgi:predicted fused transcriptional regulator/phosphomethylpyrimidine kinase/predicted transcriptional regulator